MSELINKRYRLLELLGTGGMGAVYRAQDQLTGGYVALKRVTVPGEHLRFASISSSGDFRFALAQEFRTLASLRHPNIISVLDYGFDEKRQPYYTMDLLEYAQNILDAGHDHPLEVQVGLLVQLLQALAYLHRRGILHRDLKPDNVLVVRQDQRLTVKVVDFGLAVAHNHLDEENVAGTLAYMAPEVLQGVPSSKASDLYAVGVIAYEMFAGHHPFDTSAPDAMVMDMMVKTPDPAALQIDERLKSVIIKLLNKRPEQRYGDAGEVIRLYAETTGQQSRFETDAIRESFLQAAQFIGREEELSRLAAGLDNATQRQGTLWLIGGESGVGKSRLLDELRTQALVNGILTLRGQAAQEGGLTYKIWREPLRLLTLHTTLTRLEASVLKELLPDIDQLIGESVEDAPQVDPQVAQKRMLTVIHDVFQRQTQPFLLILEDLHWAREESLDVLAALAQDLAQWPLLIVGTYRDDEVPNMPAKLAVARHIKLQRLNMQGIEALSMSILGEGGSNPHLVSLLQRESEGNVFFLVEVIRALSEDAGELNRVGRTTLPSKIFSGGIQRMIERRLNRVAPQHRRWLQIAAVLGRELDLDVLRAVSVEDLQGWLSAGAENAVFEVQEGKDARFAWRFTHDKLRETLLENLTPQDRLTIHRQIAQGLEAAAPDQTAQLAYHWRMAQDMAKEAHYSKIAGEQALKAGAYQDAAVLLERTLELNPDAPRLERARWARLLADAHLGEGNLVAGEKALREAALSANAPAPSTPSVAVPRLVLEIVTQTRSRFLGVSGSRERDQALEAARVHSQLAEVMFYTNNTLGSIYSSLAALNQAERAGVSRELAHTYANVAAAAMIGGQHGIARFYRQRALETLNSLNLTHLERAYILRSIALHDLGVADWPQFEPIVMEAKEEFERSGDLLRSSEMFNIYAQGLYDQGRFAAALDVFEQLYHAAVKTHNTMHQGWGLFNQAMCLAVMGEDLQRVIVLARDALALQEFNNDRITLPNCFGLLAWAHWHHGDAARARETADSGMGVIQPLPNSPTCFISYATLSEVYLGLWRGGDASAKDKAHQALKALKQFARSFNNGKARAALLQGMLSEMNGNMGQAERQWDRALMYAERYSMPYERALAYEQLGRSSAADKRAIQQAHTEFMRLGALRDAARLRQQPE